tara:strand:- start:17719 stop:19335 length:1617 start_codon:yes stop_codon:yes gene_type:complete
VSIIPVRDLGTVGLITDIPGYNIPLNAFTRADNVVFDERQVRRAPIFRKVKDSLGFTPRFTIGITPSTGYDQVIVVSDAWAIKEYVSGTVTDRSGSISGSSDPRPYTGSVLADIVYINREDRVPVYRTVGGTNFADLPNWTSTWRAGALRPYKDQLLALKMTEGTTSYPNRVRFSDITTANSVPGSWDATDTTKSAGFIDLVESNTPIVDGLTLGNDFIIYTSDDVRMMTFVGGAFLFNIKKLFGDTGLINTNCVVEADKKHFCFGRDDIYLHDGVSKQSIADTRIKNLVFGSLNTQQSDVCYVTHDEGQNLVYFCYQSGDANASFPNAGRCNRAAVYNYRANTWSLMDLPNTSSGTNANLNSVTTYANAGSLTYQGVGGSYYDQEDNRDRHTVMAGEDQSTDGITSDKLYGLDDADAGKLAFELDTQATKPAVLERVGLDLDEAGTGVSSYLVVTRIFPQADTENTDNTSLSFQFGASDIPRNTPTYTSAVTFDIAADHKIDSRASGRYLSYKMTVSDNKSFIFSGFDLDVTATGSR